MNNTIETNQSYQKFKEILTARHIISQWLSAVQCYYVMSSACWLSAALSASQPGMIVNWRNTYYNELNLVKVFLARRITKSAIGCS